MKDKKKSVPNWLAVLVLVGFICVISIAELKFQIDLNGLLLILLILLCGITCKLGYTFEEVLDITITNMKSNLGAIYIFILIGAMISGWIMAGSIPTMICVGINVLRPTVILPATFLLCMIVSIVAGTSWGTVSTVGIIIMEIASSMGLNMAAVAGAVISGACFGDKLSPMSDTTNLASMSNEVPIINHIKAMSRSTIPTAFICLIFYTVYGLQYSAESSTVGDLVVIQQILKENFKIDFVAVCPIIVTLFLTFVRKSHAIVSMAMGILTSCIVGVYWQNTSWKRAFEIISGGFSCESGNIAVDKLLNRGGIDSMMSLTAMSILVICIGGILSDAGFLEVLTSRIEVLRDKMTLLTVAAISSTGICCMATGDSYVPIIITSKIYRKVFDDSKIPRQYLSRCCEDGATLMVPIIPWSVTALFFSETLGVHTIQYLPFALLCWLNPIVSVIDVALFERRRGKGK